VVHAWLFYGAACNMDLWIADENSGLTLAQVKLGTSCCTQGDYLMVAVNSKLIRGGS
jgi:hypothetical protein